jgi:hypothetical protein
MEQTFQMGYKEGEKTFYVSPTNWKCEEEKVSHMLVGALSSKKRMPALRCSCKKIQTYLSCLVLLVTYVIARCTIHVTSIIACMTT